MNLTPKFCFAVYLKKSCQTTNFQLLLLHCGQVIAFLKRLFYIVLFTSNSYFAMWVLLPTSTFFGFYLRPLFCGVVVLPFCSVVDAIAHLQLLFCSEVEIIIYLKRLFYSAAEVVGFLLLLLYREVQVITDLKLLFYSTVEVIAYLQLQLGNGVEIAAYLQLLFGSAVEVIVVVPLEVKEAREDPHDLLTVKFQPVRLKTETP